MHPANIQKPYKNKTRYPSNVQDYTRPQNTYNNPNDVMYSTTYVHPQDQDITLNHENPGYHETESPGSNRSYETILLEQQYPSGEYPIMKDLGYQEEYLDENKNDGEIYHDIISNDAASSNSTLTEKTDQVNKKKFKKFLTINGNLILDSKTLSFLLSKYKLPKNAATNEFKYMRYSSVTCDAQEFRDEKFYLRQNCFAVPRKTEILICITLYDEEPYLVARTLKGVIQNINNLQNMKNSDVWGPNSWKKVVICFVADGRNKINPKTLAFFETLGVYQQGFAKSSLGEKQVYAHLYEHTTKFIPQNTEPDDVSFVYNPVPIQMLFCLKEKNKKKINSHRWCFEAFCEVLQPEIVVLLDAGTQPSDKSIYHLWNAFYMDPQVGGCCGEIKVSLGSKFQNLANPLVAAQNFEYKISNILDKPTESTFGFISVLPGAFSAYRYTALLNDDFGEGPLEKYFKGENLDSVFTNKNKTTLSGVFERNMYLAEDRILCFELVAKKNANWILKYVKSASAETDTPTAISTLIKQRRRWLNGSFFASLYSIRHFYRVWQTEHSFGRKLLIQIEFIYQAIQLIVSWFAISCFFLVFRILTTTIEDYFTGARVLAGIFLWVYIATTVMTFIILFGNRPEGTSKVYFSMLIFYVILMVYTMFAAIFTAVKSVEDFIKIKNFKELFFDNSRFRDLVVSVLSTYVLYFAASFMYFEPWHMFTSFIQYILISPTYINVFNIYAFCNLHDLSWGNRDDEVIKDETPAKMLKVSKKELEKQGYDSDKLKQLGFNEEDEEAMEGEYLITMDAPIDRDDVDRQYLENFKYLNEKSGKPAHRINRFGIKVKIDSRDEETKNKDYYAFVRSLVVGFWMGTNCCLVAVVLSMDGFTKDQTLNNSGTKRSEIFLSVILWLVTFLAAFRFVGCTVYLIRYLADKLTSHRLRRMKKVGGETNYYEQKYT